MPPKQLQSIKPTVPVNQPRQVSKTVPVNQSKQAPSTSKPAAVKTNAAVKGKQAAVSSSKTKLAVSASKTKVKSLALSPPPVKQPQDIQQSEPKKWTKEDVAATKIQALVRRFLARRQLQKKKAEQMAYEEQMERLEREAYAKMVKMYQEEMEIDRQKEQEEKRKLREMLQRQKRILEAAFDGDNTEIQAVLKEVKQLDDDDGVGNDVVGQARRAKNLLAMVDCADANNNTPLSEAAGGGHAHTIKLLVDNHANPNSRGQFQRTPLYRAAFAGHLEAVQMLLQCGADPRLYADDGQTPGQQSSFEPVRAVLDSWDISQTENYVTKLEAENERRRQEQQQSANVQAKRLEDQVEAASKEYDAVQKKLIKASEELNKRINEHDNAVASGHAKTDVTLQMIHDAEMDVELVRVDVEKTRQQLAQLRLALRDKRAEVQGKEVKTEETFQSLQVLVRELDDVLLRDVGDRIKNSPKWPLIIDCTGRAATFLRYRDTNYLNALNPQEMQPERIRMAVLGSLRFGKALVLDMMEVDMYDACERRFDEVKKGLLQSIMDKSITNSQVYEQLIRPTDGTEYGKNYFNPVFTDKFRFFIITKNPCPPQQLIDMTYPVTIVMASGSAMF